MFFAKRIDSLQDSSLRRLPFFNQNYLPSPTMASVAAASDGKERPKVLVLGGVGTIGRVFIQHLVEEGLCSKIRVVDKALPITAYCSAEHEAVLQNEEAGVEFCQADRHERSFACMQITL